MMLAKKLYLFCLNRPISVLQYISELQTAVAALDIHKFSTRKPNYVKQINSSEDKINLLLNVNNFNKILVIFSDTLKSMS